MAVWVLGCDSRRDSFLLVLVGGDVKGQGFSGTNEGERLSAFGCDSRMNLSRIRSRSCSFYELGMGRI
jgi:hypothetical protein